jgi:hypothetical protein
MHRKRKRKEDQGRELERRNRCIERGIGSRAKGSERSGINTLRDEEDGREIAERRGTGALKDEEKKRAKEEE